VDNELIYIDTNVYIDYFEGRSDGLRPLGDFAFNLIKRALSCEYKIAFSSFIEEELESNGHKTQLNELLDILMKANKIIQFETNANDEIRAAKLCKGKNMMDAKHAVIAHKCKAKYFVTRNWKDFEDYSFLELKYPENL